MEPTPPADTPSTPVPQSEAVTENPLGTVLPDVAKLRDVGIPLLLYLALLTALTTWGVLFRRSVMKRNR
ncbi:MAG TPA: hypothetical protein PK781_09605, partial [Terrimesophilobacter sp.]|nr:hypothetical protein [Terrimesophilobacter sp.]